MSRYQLDNDRCECCGAIKYRGQAPLTRTQRKVYDYLYDHIERHGFAPTFADIACEFDYSSLATVHEHLTTLERKGWIVRGHNEVQNIQCLVLKEVAA